MNSIYGGELGNALFGVLADIAGDLVLKIDRRGFIEQSSPGLQDLGVSTDGLLILPHISDLAAPRFAPEVREYVRRALKGEAQFEYVEFPLARVASQADAHTRHSGDSPAGRWFALRLRPTAGQSGDLVGALGMLRSIEKLHPVGSHSQAIGDVDHLTGLGNRHAFEISLAKRLGGERVDTLVMIEIDAFRSLNLRFGPSAGEEIICAFAEFLLVMLGDASSLSRLKDARFAFFLKQGDPRKARNQVEELLRTFAELSSDLADQGRAVSVSAGLVALSKNGEFSAANAEKALILASANGGSQAKIGEDLPHYLARERRIS